MRRFLVRSPLWSPAPCWLGRCQYIVTGLNRTHDLPALSRVWQPLKLSDVMNGTHPRHSLVVDEDVKKPNKETISSEILLFFSCSFDSLPLGRHKTTNAEIEVETSFSNKWFLGKSACLVFSFAWHSDRRSAIIITVGRVFQRRENYLDFLALCWDRYIFL